MKTDKISPVSLPNSILANHVPKPKAEVNSLRAGISLDAGALVKQSLSPKKSYANINAEDKLTGNGVIQNGPCSLPKENGFLPNPSNTYLKNEPITGISC